MQNNVRIVFLLNIYELIIIGLLQTEKKGRTQRSPMYTLMQFGKRFILM